MGQINGNFCEMCAKSMPFVEREVVFQQRVVDGHDMLSQRSYDICADCSDKLIAYMDTRRGEASAKWVDRKDPTKITITLPE